MLKKLQTTEDSLQAAEKQLGDSEYVIAPDVMQRMKPSVFLIRQSNLEDSAGVGSGVFFANGLPVTADHILQQWGWREEGTPVYATCNDQSITLTVQKRVSEFDYALLRYDGEHAFLPVHRGNATSLVSSKVALCGFQIGLDEELQELHGFDDTLGVLDAAVVRVSNLQHHLVLSSGTWSVDSGAAVVLHNGDLLGIHLAGVNAIREELERREIIPEQPLTALEESLAAAAQSVSSGCIALHARVFAESS